VAHIGLLPVSDNLYASTVKCVLFGGITNSRLFQFLMENQSSFAFSPVTNQNFIYDTVKIMKLDV